MVNSKMITHKKYRESRHIIPFKANNLMECKIEFNRLTGNCTQNLYDHVDIIEKKTH